MNSELNLAGGHARARAAIALLTTAVILFAGCAREQPAAPATAASGESAAEHALKHTDPLYRCPMHPDVVRNEPGECPICGMALVKVEPELLRRRRDPPHVPDAAQGRDGHGLRARLPMPQARKCGFRRQ